MRKLLALLILAVGLSAYSQENYDTMFVYRNNGTIDKILVATIDSITFTSPIGGEIEVPDIPNTPSESGIYTVAEALAAYVEGEQIPAIVTGYIVGTINGQVYEEGCVFSGRATTVTNLLIADKADETDVDNCMPVQLPKTAIRDALNLVDNPQNYKKKVALTGSIEKYFGIAGLKSVTAYEIDSVSFDNGGSTEQEKPAGIYINETFASDFGVFTPVETVGNYPWIIDYSTAKATSYFDGANNAAVSWIISVPVNFSEETEAYVSFEYIVRYSDASKLAENHQLLISANYSGDAAAATWVDVPYNVAEGSDWTTFYKANVAVPMEFIGKNNVVFALRYTATTKSSTWEVRNFIVAHGTAGTTPDAPDSDEPTDTPTEVVEYTVSEAIAAFNGIATPAKVKGYIVGTIDGKAIADGAVFSGTATANTNLLIADNADETDVNNCMPVQLPAGDVRIALNLVDNTGNYKKEVLLTGSLEKYFGVAGLKSVTAYEINGVSSEPETPDTPSVPVGENILENAGFEEWYGNTPVAWGGTGHNATIEQSTDAHSGEYSVLVNGYTSGNKRLASNSYVLPAGTYRISAYLKQSGETVGQFRLGYIKLTNGKIENTSKDYVYVTEATEVSASWSLVAAEFTLEEVVEVAVVIMNSKLGGGAPILVDDVSIVPLN